MTQKTRRSTITDNLYRLEAIVGWFDRQEGVDLDQGLKKMREGGELIKRLKRDLKEVENEFEEIQKELNDNE